MNERDQVKQQKYSKLASEKFVNKVVEFIFVNKTTPINKIIANFFIDRTKRQMNKAKINIQTVYAVLLSF